jgi:fibro-slime domain-containing protein
MVPSNVPRLAASLEPFGIAISQRPTSHQQPRHYNGLIRLLAVASMIVSTISATGVTVPVVWRDMSGTGGDDAKHWAFHNEKGDARGCIADDLGADGKPQLKSSIKSGSTCWKHYKEGDSSTASFKHWYHRSTPGVLGSIYLENRSTSNAGISRYTYASEFFFPVGPGNTLGFGTACNVSKYLFTTEIALTFKYQSPDQQFSFAGDDDVFVFINRKLAVDLGGVHNRWTGSVVLGERSSFLDIELGQNYELHIFHAERHPVESVFSMDTSLEFNDPDVCPGECNSHNDQGICDLKSGQCTCCLGWSGTDCNSRNGEPWTPPAGGATPNTMPTADFLRSDFCWDTCRVDPELCDSPPGAPASPTDSTGQKQCPQGSTTSTVTTSVATIGAGPRNPMSTVLATSTQPRNSISTGTATTTNAHSATDMPSNATTTTTSSLSATTRNHTIPLLLITTFGSGDSGDTSPLLWLLLPLVLLLLGGAMFFRRRHMKGQQELEQVQPATVDETELETQRVASDDAESAAGGNGEADMSQRFSYILDEAEALRFKSIRRANPIFPGEGNGQLQSTELPIFIEPTAANVGADPMGIQMASMELNQHTEYDAAANTPRFAAKMAANNNNLGNNPSTDCVEVDACDDFFTDVFKPTLCQNCHNHKDDHSEAAKLKMIPIRGVSTAERAENIDRSFSGAVEPVEYPTHISAVNSVWQAERVSNETGLTTLLQGSATPTVVSSDQPLFARAEENSYSGGGLPLPKDMQHITIRAGRYTDSGAAHRSDMLADWDPTSAPSEGISSHEISNSTTEKFKRSVPADLNSDVGEGLISTSSVAIDIDHNAAPLATGGSTTDKGNAGAGGGSSGPNQEQSDPDLSSTEGEQNDLDLSSTEGEQNDILFDAAA